MERARLGSSLVILFLLSLAASQAHVDDTTHRVGLTLHYGFEGRGLRLRRRSLS